MSGMNDARFVAAEMVFDVLEEGVMLSAGHEGLADLPPEGRARAQSLARTTLRHLSNLDLCLKPFLRRAPVPAVHAILRVAVAEMLVMGAPAHAVVGEAVRNAGRIPSGKSATGLVNAVLRKVSVEGPERIAALPAPRLASWLRGRLQNAYGDAATRAMEQVFAVETPLDLTVRNEHFIPGATVLPNGSLRLSPGQRVTGLPGYAEGAFWVQDAAASIPVQALGALNGLRVLDVCAAPGGKTLQLAAAGADVTALDLSDKRLDLLRENLTRCGLDAKIHCADALSWAPEDLFDVVVLDAPCSATGTLRRHPDLPHLKDGSAVKELCVLQDALIRRTSDWVKPGGRFLYITCSLLPEEGELQVQDLPGFVPEPIDPVPFGGDQTWNTPSAALRLRPDFWSDAGGMDGFFAALFHKPL